VYLTGETNSSLDLDPGPSELFVRPDNPSTANYDVYVVKLDTSGNLAWGHAFGNDEWDIVDGIGVDNAGNVFVVGNFVGTVDFDPGPDFFFFEAQGESDVYAVKYDANGNFVSLRVTGGTSRDPGDDVFTDGASVDPAGNVYTFGTYKGTIDFDPSATGETRLTEIADSNFAGDLFVQKLDSDGQFVWVKTATSQAFMSGTDLAIGSGGNVHLAGSFNFDAVFDPGPDAIEFEALGGTTDPFIWKIEGGANPADINNDGTVDAVDIQLVINAALGLSVAQNTDINGDNTTDAVDVQLVINAALGA
jgi:hypothetical protein